MKQANPEARWKHEECSTKIFRYMLAHNQELKNILDKYLNEIDYVFIEEMINPPKEFIINGEWQLQGRYKNKSFLYDIVSNKHDCIDVDKFDYLMRDSKSTKISIPFCKTALGRIQIYMEARDFDFGYSRIVYGRKIRDNINGVMFSREDLHTKLYQHKTVVACETMIVDAWLKATPYFKVLTEQGEYDLVHAIENIEAFLQLNDLLLEQILQSKDPYLKESQAILQKIENRHTLRLIGQTFLFSNCKKTTAEIKNEILKLDNTIHPNSVIVVIREIHRGKSIEDDPITEVRIFNEANPTDNETNQLSYYWKETNIASKTGKRNVYIFVPYETSLIEKDKIFVAFEKLCKKINCCELPVKRQRLSSNSLFICYT
jgi:HD superfamily phosphohydrolase